MARRDRRDGAFPARYRGARGWRVGGGRDGGDRVGGDRVGGDRVGGDIDTTDLMVGLGLCIGIPVVAAFLLPIFGLPLSTSAGVSEVREKKLPEAVARTEDELRQEYIYAGKVYDESATYYFQRWSTDDNPTMKEYDRQWAKVSLLKSQEMFENVRRALGNSPADYPGLQRLEGTIVARLGDIKRQLAELERENPLGL